MEYNCLLSNKMDDNINLSFICKATFLKAFLFRDWTQTQWYLYDTILFLLFY